MNIVNILNISRSYGTLLRNGADSMKYRGANFLMRELRRRGVRRTRLEKRRLPAPYFSSPNTPTPVVVPTYTLPLAIMGVMYLFPLPK